ncbi:TPA: type IV secretory system conjugative DNA transfer family protein [Legionella pneumophila]
MPKKHMLLRLILTLSVFILYAQLISALSLQELNCHLTPYPWYGFILLHQGFYSEVLYATLMITPLFLLAYGCIRTGIIRYLSMLVLSGIVFLLLSFIMGIFMYEGFYGQELSFGELIPFLWDLNNDPLNDSYFLISQGSAALLMTLIALYTAFERWRPANSVLGNAHFAHGLEIKKAGFLDKENESIIIGKKFGAPLYSNGFEHVLVFAPSGSGKTRSIAIPNLFNYPYSMVCNDVKLTLFNTTSGYRERVLENRCYCWALANPEGKTHRFNPLSFISEDRLLRMTDIQRIAHILIPDNSKEAAIWAQSSRKLFKALVLYLLDTPVRPTTLGEINRLIKQQNFDEWLLHLLEETDGYDPEFYRNGFSYINAHEETRTSILVTFSGYLELFDDPIVDAATSASDFDIRTLRSQKTTIYIGFTDEDMERLSPILTLFWQQLISAMIKEVPCPINEPYPLLCLIDEFSSLGRIERLRRSLKLLREYRVRCILMFQYIAQTYERYSHDEAKAFTNIKTKIAYGSEDNSDAEFISKMLGTRTKKVVTRSVSNQANGGFSDSKNVNYQAIPLLRPEEVTKLKPHIALIIRSGSSPIKASQFIWYKEECMKKLPQNPSAVPQQVIQQEPFIRQKKKSMKQKLVKKEKEPAQEEAMELDWIDN